jgi:hypothetical protein
VTSPGAGAKEVFQAHSRGWQPTSPFVAARNSRYCRTVTSVLSM